jgi:septum formation protein
MPKLILASQSPRRQNMLKAMGYTFDVRIANTDEIIDINLPLDEALIKVAREKADAISSADDEVVLAADTIVILNQRVLGKPKDEKDARCMLKSLSNQTHVVMTAIVVKGYQRHQAYVCETKVRFNALDDQLIEAYVKSGLAMDKAGAYGIQDDYPLVQSIEGEYENVMGLPLLRLQTVLQEFGF